MSKPIALLSFLLLQLLISEAAATQTALQSDATSKILDLPVILTD